MERCAFLIMRFSSLAACMLTIHCHCLEEYFTVEAGSREVCLRRTVREVDTMILIPLTATKTEGNCPIDEESWFVMNAYRELIQRS